MLSDIETTAFAIYMECIRLYTSRQLSEAKDILAAFQGMSNLFGHEMKAPFHFGLPTSHFDIALLWHSNTACQRRLPRPDVDNEFGGLVFPSWSWAGRAGSNMFYDKDALDGCLVNVSQWLAEHTWIQWFIRDGHGDLRPVWRLPKKAQPQNVSWTRSRWLGYGWYEETGNDHYGRMVKHEYCYEGSNKPLTKGVFTCHLPEYPFGINKADPSVADKMLFPDQPYLQFWTWSAHLRVLARTRSDVSSSESSHSQDASQSHRPGDGLIHCEIEDYCGDWCGTIVLNASWLEEYSNLHQDQHSVHEFIAISEAKQFSEQESAMWTYYVPQEQENADWDLFYVLLVTRIGGICYRQGLGKVFKEAFAKSYLPGKEWKEIIMC
jgi:hypothetical protein